MKLPFLLYDNSYPTFAASLHETNETAEKIRTFLEKLALIPALVFPSITLASQWVHRHTFGHVAMKLDKYFN